MFLILRCQQNIITISEPRANYHSKLKAYNWIRDWGEATYLGTIIPALQRQRKPRLWGEPHVQPPAHPVSTRGRRFGNRQHAQNPGTSACSTRTNKGDGQGLWNCGPSPATPRAPPADQGIFRSCCEGSDSEQTGCTGAWREHQCKPTLNMFLHTNVLSLDHVKYV